MDIDSTDVAAVASPPLPLPEFSASFPLPFRVLFLVGLAILLWAANLHVLSLLGLDVSWVLDIRDGDDGDIGLEPDGYKSFDPDADSDDARSKSEPDTPRRTADPVIRIATPIPRPPSSYLYAPVYRLFGGYAAWCFAGWVVFRLLTGGDTVLMERFRALVGLICLGPIVAALVPFRGYGARERRALRKALWRCINPPTNQPIFFCDVILADIATSFAKVLGDLWVGTHQLLFGGVSQGRVAQHGVGKWITLAMVW
jgi:hypothetical protein